MSIFDPGPNPWKHDGGWGADDFWRPLKEQVEHQRATLGDVCDHWPLPVYDPEAARNMPVDEIRKKFPRVVCMNCGTVQYTSFEHYLAGDW